MTTDPTIRTYRVALPATVTITDHGTIEVIVDLAGRLSGEVAADPRPHYPEETIAADAALVDEAMMTSLSNHYLSTVLHR